MYEALLAYLKFASVLLGSVAVTVAFLVIIVFVIHESMAIYDTLRNNPDNQE